MRRGDPYRVRKPGSDPKRYHAFVVVSRHPLIDLRFATVVCAPMFTSGERLAIQIAVGPPEGLRHPSWIMCDNLVSLPKAELTNFLGSLGAAKSEELNKALRIALGV